MSDREKFEAWAKTSDGNCNDRDLERRHDGDYHNMLVQRDWEVWQASRRAALEEAAKAALNDSLDAIWADGRLMDPREVGSACADAIRALSQKDPQ